MKGVNRVTISGNVSGSIRFQETRNGVAACSFSLVSDKPVENNVVKAWVRVNVYGERLVGQCRQRLERGVYVIVDGELMNRDGQYREMTEVRAQEMVFVRPGRDTEEREHGDER